MRKRIISMLLVVSILGSLLLTGCAPAAPSNGGTTILSTEGPALTSEATETTTQPTETTSVTEPTVTTEPSVETEPAITAPPEPETDEYGMTEQQRNSFSMLYYLAITAEEIRIAKDNRVQLDDIYSSLLNDINPSAIDEETQAHLRSLRDVIKDYMQISIKRDRLQYIYNQNKAAAVRSAVPDPLAILSMANALDWKKLALSAVYTVVDSYSNYKSASNSADQDFLMSGWELDDEQTATIQRNRERAFDYMVDIVQKYDLDGMLTLNERAIEDFAEICAIESVQQKIRRLESAEKTYKLLGNYWLELADCYFETSQYAECLDCIDTYNALATGIYRKDYNYVQILPKAIVAAQAVYTGDEYISCIEIFADAILENTNDDDWSIRYFAAQAYLDLYVRADDRQYLEKAYNIAYDNVTVLLDEQQSLNRTYLAPVQEVKVEEPDYRFMTEDQKKEAEKQYKEEIKRLKAYNKELHKLRKTELLPLYEPLVLNCDLLFALANEMNIVDTEKAQIEAILQTGTNGVFLSKPVNDRYSFSAPSIKYDIEFSKDEIVVPANLLSADARVVVSITDGAGFTTIGDCVITKVDRKDAGIESFFAYISSEQMTDYEWSANSKVTVKVHNRNDYEPIEFNFKVKEYKDNWLIADRVVFEEA